MLCEICKSKEACVHVKQIVNGAVNELHACVPCAEAHGIAVKGVPALGSMLFGTGAVSAVQNSMGVEASCPECHMRESDFRRTHRLGCPACYSAFKEGLGPMLQGMHRGSLHVGKVPAGEQSVMALRLLQDELAQAVSEQRFEDAATLRDRIRSLQEAECVLPNRAGLER